MLHCLGAEKLSLGGVDRTRRDGVLALFGILAIPPCLQIFGIFNILAWFGKTRKNSSSVAWNILNVQF
jgi:hypothetical protein